MSSPASDAPGRLAIRASGLSKRYDDVVAVDGLDLAIERGSVYGFLGPNGSGKTTTMRMLTTLTRPTAGTATVAGTSIENREALIGRVGYLPESPPVFDELTGRENLRYVTALHDVPRGEARERIADYLRRFDLADAADRRVEGYSTGMRKKLGLVQTVVHRPDVVLLDEPTSGLDPRAARTVKDLIATLAERDVTIFLSTHILSVVDELADQVGVLSNGRIVTEGPPEELKSRAERGADATLEDVFLQVTEDHDAESAGRDADAGTGAGGESEVAR